MGLEAYAVGSSVRRSFWGLGVGAVIALVLICGGVYAILQDHDTAGATIITGVVVSLTAVFVLGRQATTTSLAEKGKAVKKK
jgi:hypothetical protein